MSGTAVMSAVRRAARPLRVSIEGNIGSGKSTVIRHLARLSHVEAHPEPLEEWRDVRGHNLLQLMYTDMPKWSFSFQHYVHLSRLRIQTSAPRDPSITVKVFERSVQNSRHCFVENARAERFLAEPEYQVLQSWFNFTEQHCDISLDYVVYLRTSPQVAFERIQRRARAEESDIPLHYLEQVHYAYEHWLGADSTWAERDGCKLVTVNADQDLNSVLCELDQLQAILEGTRLHS